MDGRCRQLITGGLPGRWQVLTALGVLTRLP